MTVTVDVDVTIDVTVTDPGPVRVPDGPDRVQDLLSAKVSCLMIRP